jgi:hypothetical protein
MMKMMQRRLENSFIYVSEVDGKIVSFANFSHCRNHCQVFLVNFVVKGE